MVSSASAVGPRRTVIISDGRRCAVYPEMAAGDTTVGSISSKVRRQEAGGNQLVSSTCSIVQGHVWGSSSNPVS